MAITTSCSECKAKTVDGVMEHIGGCSAYMFKPTIMHEQRPPAIEIHFDTLEEQAEWMRKLTGSHTNTESQA